MAFNGLQPSSGPYYLCPNGTALINVWFGSPGDDEGAQWIMAHPISAASQPPAQLTVSGFTKELQYQIGSSNEDGGASYSEPYYIYSVTVTNTGGVGVYFSVQGGGNT